MNHDRNSNASNINTPIIIGPAAAAAAEQVEEESALVADFPGFAHRPVGATSGPRGRSSATENDAKRLLFGPQLGARGIGGGVGSFGGGDGGGGTSGRAVGSGSAGGSGKAIRGMGLTSSLKKRLTKSGKRQGGVGTSGSGKGGAGGNEGRPA